MKWLLFLSILINISLGYLLLREKNSPELERVIIETHREEGVEKVKSSVPVSKKIIVKEKSLPTAKESPKEVVRGNIQDGMPPEIVSDRIVEVNERNENARYTFLTEKLGLGNHEINMIEAIKKEYADKTQKLLGNKGWYHPSLEERRQMLDLEFERARAIEKKIGTKNWKAYQDFINSYNKKLMSREIRPDEIIIPLDI